jgi:hypothetical protein
LRSRAAGATRSSPSSAPSCRSPPPGTTADVLGGTPPRW